MPKLTVPENLYQPEDINLSNNYNVLNLSEIHAFEEKGYQRDEYCREVGEQINSYTEQYDIDEVWILGDTGTFNDVYNVLNGIENEELVLRLVAGDEDKVSEDNKCERQDGWLRQIDSPNAFNTEFEYKLYDEGFETSIEGLTVQAAHHPHHKDRDSFLTPPDYRDSDILDDLFSVDKDTNRNTIENAEDLGNADMMVYDHVHMPYTRSVDEKILHGLGGRRYNYMRDTEAMPTRSLHICSFDEDRVHTLHFDAEHDEIFEHLLFNKEDGEFQRYDVPTPMGENSSMYYKPLQSRFHNDHIRREAWETEEDMPILWIED